jgi:hypothetical protein
MRKISGYSLRISFLLFFVQGIALGQDTVDFPLRFGIGTALFSPVSALAGKYPGGVEVNGAFDLSERLSIALDGGFSRFRHEVYNYTYENHGAYFRGGADYNMLTPVQAAGRYYAGISLRYGLSFFSHESPSIEYDNYWGEYHTQKGNSFHVAHFLEVSPGVRAELFRNFFIGWSVNARLLIWSGTGKDLRAVDIPGFGNGSRPFAAGFNYYLSLRFPYRSKRVIYIKPDRGETGETTEMKIPIRN